MIAAIYTRKSSKQTDVRDDQKSDGKGKTR